MRMYPSKILCHAMALIALSTASSGCVKRMAAVNEPARTALAFATLRSVTVSADASRVEPFRKKLGALAEIASVLDSEFCRETVRCGADLASVMGEFQAIGARKGYCERARGFDEECNALYGAVDKTIGHVEALRGSCMV